MVIFFFPFGGEGLGEEGRERRGGEPRRQKREELADFYGVILFSNPSFFFKGMIFSMSLRIHTV